MCFQLSLMCKTRLLPPFDNFLSSPLSQKVWWLLFLLWVTDGRSLFPTQSACETNTFFIYILFVWKCSSITFYTSKQGWWILPLENALPVGAIMCAVTQPVIVFSTTSWKSLLLPCFCPRLLFLFFSPRCTIETSVAEWKLMTLYFKYSLLHSNQRCNHTLGKLPIDHSALSDKMTRLLKATSNSNGEFSD